MAEKKVRAQRSDAPELLSVLAWCESSGALSPQSHSGTCSLASVGGTCRLASGPRTSTSDDLKTRLVARPAGPTRPLRAPRDPTVVVGAVELVKAGIPNLGGQPFSASESGVNLYDIPPGRRVTSRASFDHCSRPSCRFEDLESAVRSPPSASSLRPPRGNYDAHLPHILARSPSIWWPGVFGGGAGPNTDINLRCDDRVLSA